MRWYFIYLDVFAIKKKHIVHKKIFVWVEIKYYLCRQFGALFCL